MLGPVDVVPARPEDADAVRDLVRAAYRRYVPRIGREPAPMTADYDSDITAGRVRLVRADGALVAVLVTVLEEGALLVENVAVRPGLQGTGIGALLLERAEAIAREEGRTRVRLFTNAAMTENLGFYRRHGFAETGRRVEDGFERVFFEKVLTSAEDGADSAR